MKKVVNQYDPSLLVTVVDVTGIQPDTLHYNLRDKDRTVMTVEPSFDEFGDPAYSVPRYYAERLLQNLGGRIFRLVSPLKLTIKMPNGRGGSEPKTIIACKKCGDGKWHELTEEEIQEIEASFDEEDGVNPPVQKAPKEPKESKAQKAPKEPGMSKKATKTSTKKTEEAPLANIDSDPDDIENDGTPNEPSLEDVLGNDGESN